MSYPLATSDVMLTAGFKKQHKRAHSTFPCLPSPGSEPSLAEGKDYPRRATAQVTARDLTVHEVESDSVARCSKRPQTEPLLIPQRNDRERILD